MSLITEEFQLLGDSFSTHNTPLRPPWSIAERPFVKTCDQCGDCVDACPEQVLVLGRGDYPEIDFSRGGCTLCGDCARVCRAGGLRTPDAHPWDLKAFIAETCVTNRDEACDACRQSCPHNAISLRQQVGNTAVPILDEMLCNGCGNCVSVCPAAAIHVYSVI